MAYSLCKESDNLNFPFQPLNPIQTFNLQQNFKNVFRIRIYLLKHLILFTVSTQYLDLKQTL